LATAASTPVRRRRHPVQEAQHAGDLSGAVERDHVEPDHQLVLARSERPDEPGLVVVAVDRSREPERASRELSCAPAISVAIASRPVTVASGSV
jgi:hypothetical protein